MRKNTKKKSFPEDEFVEYIKRLQKKTDYLIIVEGKKDKEALKFWNINNPIEPLKQPIYSFVERIVDKYTTEIGIVLLLDHDKEGRRLHKILKNEFRKQGFQVNTSFWVALPHFHLTHVEGLNSPFFKEQRNKLSTRFLNEKEL